MQLDTWLTSIAAQRWPVLPQTHARIRQELARGSERLRFEVLANLTLSDPFLLLDLLRLMATSTALQRSGSLPAVEQMLMVVGSERIMMRYRQLTAWPEPADRHEFAVQEEVAGLMGRARIAALIVKAWLSLAGEHKVEDSFVAAEIYNLPACLYLLQHQQRLKKPALQQMAEQFAMDYPPLLAAFIQRMPLPEGLNALLGSGVPGRHRQLLKLAVACAEGLDQGWWRPAWQAGVSAAAHLMGVTYSEAYQAVVHAVLQVARNPQAPAYTFAAHRFLAMEGDIPLADEPCLPPSLDVVARTDLAIRGALRYLANDLGFERVLFYRLNEAGDTLRLQFQIGLKSGDVLLQQMPLMKSDGLPALLLGRPQGFLLTPALHARLQVKYADAWLSALSGNDVALLSVYVEGRPLGLFVVDNAGSGRAIDDACYQQFKLLATRVASLSF
ncbi:histidine kinase [Rhodobacteraceae bacterium CH30]|nr:histidine kinase [Rhodobacteraceae bacterium CH30]